MARTITEVKTSMTTAFVSNLAVQNMYGLDPSATFDAQFSLLSFENVFFSVLAIIAWTLENIFDVHKNEISALISEQKVPGRRWYRNQALRFQYGFDLLPQSGHFSPYFNQDGVPILATPDQIEASKIVKYAAITKSKTSSKISMKIAPENGDDIFTDDQMIAFGEYMEEIQAVGDHIVIVNYRPDILKLRFKIVYNPLVLLPTGQSILTGGFPVKDSVKAFLKSLPFDGELSVQQLEKAILETEGVKDLQNLKVESKWIEPGMGYGFLQPIEISRIPKSGRFTLIDDVTNEEDWSGIEYIIYEAE
ncbi:hypothetical protein [Chryseobacterium koreense]|uniref:Nucleotidyltransferase n=1 Tax=Chryseobacterium koreense CCUG 49689 TaxID=1304281 RepID=A0A0J7IVD8_9FLAO|nr:hypothetical protein [Chryseobacterium koreense]KMQ70248.1 hypothetical protein ACM44_13425 [Chryseobacterium koreense CCUG 49689]MBB5334749.1 hypothetical protein [Chryseobacterium koreense]